ncbi:HD domain-containing phosphohydrolase [Desulfosoma caldarium]|uniref:HD-GYP domain-containing protein (C-di-GMP phosphodiesterase class II) n=1 Tax=Desulfosoma caldarium TaxID=610254 RepID=A0A3N1VLT1_9BACT|nr:HD domain-containing phosphohydrolase [Desulfosoma caldarium]ROR01921.1 HD-GYP domain-containing protein (c-di-GMP phosphodiesterase class II) [Desulfosoma caldarium]
MNILIVEDDQLLGEILRDYLLQLGHEKVLVCSRASEALRAFEHQKFDCAFIDLKLPDMDGVNVLGRLKERDRTLPVIMMSGYPTMDATIGAMRLGASDFLTKPFTLQDLALAMERVVKERALLLENVSLKLECQAQEQLKVVNKELQKKIRFNDKLFHISRAIDETRSSDDLYTAIADLAASVVPGKRVGFFIYLPDHQRIVLMAHKGLSNGHLPKILPVSDMTLRHLLAQEKRPVRAALRSIVSAFSALSQNGSSNGSKHETNRVGALSKPFSESSVSFSMAGILNASCSLWPLWIRGELFGFLVLLHEGPEKSTGRDEEALLDFLVKKAALAVENMALYESLISNFYGILRSLVNALEAKDPYTGKHSERVTQIAVELAREMCVGETYIEILNTVGYLHDIGKIGMPDEILNKPGALTREEYEVVKRHPVIGESIIKDLGLGAEERAIIRHHHERWDGLGYPDGLAGENIPLLARIVAVADAFDAMTSKRAYRDSLPVEKAVAELVNNRNKQFDPNVVDAFLSSFAKKVSRGRHEQQRVLAGTHS